MPLPAGTRLGHYEIISLIGHGGMGAVHAARDTRLNRIVALKVLHEAAPDFRDRFAREARAVAALQHPHICTLYDVGSHEGIDYLVMEHLEGTPLEGPLPTAQVLAYGIQIADALDAAHRKGVTHRDLKPANIMVTKSGVKVLDFGIARVSGLETVTGPGEILGTPAYMAPEQWAGAPPDPRTDIYGLGRLLAEMATGRNDPEPHIEPAALDAIVQGCLAKDPDDRWQSARDVRRMLEAIARMPEPTRPILRESRPRRGWWIAAIAAALIAGAAIGWRVPRGPAAATNLHLSVAPPAGSTFVVSRNVEGGIALSPDGRSLAFVASTAGHVQLWVRRLDSDEARAIPGTTGAYQPFWSPDSQHIAFYTPDRLMRIPADGGPVQTIVVTDPRSGGGDWVRDDVLLVTGHAVGEIHRIRAVGGETVKLADGHWPHALDDGRRFLYAGPDGVRIGSVDRPGESQLIDGVPRGRVAFALGHLIYARDRRLFAQPFDPDRARLIGDPFPIAQSLLMPLAPAAAVLSQPSFSVAPDGVLAYAAGDLVNRLRWRDRSGRPLSDVVEPGQYLAPRISPDGKAVAYTRLDAREAGIWISRVDSASPLRLTYEAVADQYPIWSHDGTSITYATGPLDRFDLFRRPADGTGTAERLTSMPSNLHAMDWSTDGRHLVFTQNNAALGTDILILTDAGGRVPYMFLQTAVSEAHTQFAPGVPPRWIAYTSDHSGRREVYVTPFVPGQPASAARWQLSTQGGTMPRWRGDGKELFYWALDGWIMAVPVDGSVPAFSFGAPERMFPVHTPTLRTNRIEFDVRRDGQRFLLLEPSEQTSFQSLAIVTRWLTR